MSFVIVLILIITTIAICGYFWRKDWFGGHNPVWPHGVRADASPPFNVRNVLLISIDTCRADYLSCYGYSRETTPNIDALADEAFQFNNAFSPVPLTLPAHCSMMTGTDPLYHGVHDNNNYQLDPSSITLAEVVKQQGFATGAIIAAVPLDGQYGLNQGFDSYDDRLEIGLDSRQAIERRAEQVSRNAINWIEQHHRDRFFLFVHYFDPHETYDPPHPFRSDSNDRKSLYADEISYTDHWIGQLIDKLKALSLYESTLIIITSDHGEMLGEHGELTHSFFIYRNALRVPLLIRFPEQRRTKRIKHNVGLIDILPTVCGALGFEMPPDVQGIDLSAYFTSRVPQGERYLYCESLTPTKYAASALLGIVAEGWQYIHTTRPELYDLSQDPQQLTNVVESEPETARRLRQLLQQTVTQQHRKGAAAKLSLDEESLKKLEGIGYVGRSSASEEFNFEQTQEKDDPKQLIDFHDQHIRVTSLIQVKKYDEAASLCTQMLRRRPSFIDGYLYLAKIAMDRRQFDQAAEYLDSALQINPKDIYANLNMGRSLTNQGRYDDAVSYFRRALEVRPDFIDAHFALGLALQSQQKFDEAIEHFKFLTRHKPGHFMAFVGLGSAYLASSQLDKAETVLRKALELEPKYAEAHVRLGQVIGRMGHIDDAISHFRQALALSPQHDEAHYSLGVALQMQGHSREAIDHYLQVLASDPNRAEAHNNLGILLGSEAAIEHYQKAVSIAPDYFEARLNLANALAEQGELDEAINHYEQVLVQRPRSAQAHHGLGAALVARGHVVRGMEYLRKAMGWDRNWHQPYMALSRILATSQDATLRDPDEAIRLGRKAVHLTEERDPQALEALASAYASAGQFEGAVTTARQGLELARYHKNAGLEKRIAEQLARYMQAKPYMDVSGEVEPRP